MRAIIIFSLFISLQSVAQDTLTVKLPLIQNETPMMVGPYQSNYSSNLYYRSLERYKIIIPLDFKFRKGYFYYRDYNKRTYKIYY